MSLRLVALLEVIELIVVHHLEGFGGLKVAQLAAEDHDAVLGDGVLQQMLRVEREELAFRTPERLVGKSSGTEFFPDLLDVFGEREIPD